MAPKRIAPENFSIIDEEEFQQTQQLFQQQLQALHHIQQALVTRIQNFENSISQAIDNYEYDYSDLNEVEKEYCTKILEGCKKYAKVCIYNILRISSHNLTENSFTIDKSVVDYIEILDNKIKKISEETCLQCYR